MLSVSMAISIYCECLQQSAFPLLCRAHSTALRPAQVEDSLVRDKWGAAVEERLRRLTAFDGDADCDA